MAVNPLGSEILVNTFTVGDQKTFPALQLLPTSAGSIAMDADGDFVVVWSSQGQDNPTENNRWGVYAQRYNAAGVAQGSEFLVNTVTTDSQLYATVAMDPDGDFVITWTSYGQEGSGSRYGIYAKRYNAAGAVQGSEFRVNTTTVGDQQFSTVATDALGNFVISWTGVTSGSGNDVYFQRYSATGIAQGSEFRINTTTVSDQENSTVAMDAAGNFVVTWTSVGQDGNGKGIYTRRFDALGVAQTGEILVNTRTSGAQENASVAIAPSGNFIVVWTSPGDTQSTGVYARIFDSAGVAQTPEILVNTRQAQEEQNPTVAVDASGNFVVTWSSFGQDLPRSWGVYGQRFSPLGTPLGTEFLINTTTAGDQQYSSVAMETNGDFAVVWTGQDADASGVYLQRYGLPPNTSPVTTGIIPPVTDLEDASNRVINLFDYFQDAEDLDTDLRYEIASNTSTALFTSIAVDAATGNLTLDYAPNANGTADITIRAIDTGGLAVVSAPFTVTVTPVNDTPIVTTTLVPPDVTYTENAAALIIDDALTVSDIDSPNLTRATVTISNFVPLEDSLAFSNQVNITGTFDPGTGILTLSALSGSDTRDAFQAALRTVQYFNSSESPNVSDRTITFTVSDDGSPPADSNSATRTVKVFAVNDAPTTIGISNINVGVNSPDTPISLYAAFDDVDNPDAALTYTVSSNSNPGLFSSTTVNPVTGQLVLAYNPNTPGVSSIIVRATDPAGLFVETPFTVTVTGSAPPVITLTGNVLYTENTAAVVVDGGLGITDTDSLELVGATVTITNFVAGDSLNFTNQGNITGIFSANVLTLSGQAAIATYQSALESITFVSTSDDPGTTRSIQFVVNDGTAFSSPVIKTIAITPINDAPVVAPSGGDSTYTENGSAVAIDNGILVSDVDNLNLASASVAIVGPALGDVLEFAAPSGITGSYDATSGVLSFTGSATVGNYQTALRSVTYRSTSESPSITPRTIQFTVNDGTDNSNVGTRIVNVVAVPDPPVGSVSGADLTYTENGLALIINSGSELTVSDADSNLESATITLNNFAAGDILEFTSQFGITGVFNTTTGELNLTGSATADNYQTVLRSLTYRSLSENPAILPRSIQFSVNDGTNTVTLGSRNINVIAVNDIPTGAIVPVSVGVNAPNTVINLYNAFADAEDADAALTYAIVSGSITNPGLFSSPPTIDTTGPFAQLALAYVPNTPGTSNITVRVTDTGGLSVDSTFAVTVVASAPPIITLTSGDITYTENTAPVVIDRGLGVTDSDSTLLTQATVTITNYVQGQDSLTFTAITGNPIVGAFDIATGVLTLTGSADVAQYQSALESITYSNASENPNPATRVIEFAASDGAANSNPKTLNITIVPINDAPIVTTTIGASTYVENAAALPIDSTLSVSDVDSPNLTGATVAIANFLPEDALTFAPTAGIPITGSYDNSTGVLTLTGSTSIINYRNALRSVGYVNSSENPNPTDRQIQFTVTDDGLANSNVGIRTVKVTAVNDAPVVAPLTGAIAYTENAPAMVIDSTLTVSDVDSLNLASATVEMVGFVPGEDVLAFTNTSEITGIFSDTTGILTLTGLTSPANYAAALHSVTYRNLSDNPTVTRTIQIVVNDGSANSSPVTRTVNITPINDAPTTSGIGDLNVGVNAPNTVIELYNAFADAEDADSALVYELVSNTNPGLFTSAAINPTNGQLTLAYVANGFGESTITVKATDSGGLLVQTFFKVTVAPSSPPVITITPNPLTYTENDPALPIGNDSGGGSGISLSDPDSTNLTGATVTLGGFVPGQDVLTFSNQSTITGIFDGSTGVLTLTGSAPIADYQTALRSITYSSGENPGNTPRTLQISVTDGSANSLPVTRTLQVIAVNDVPIVTTTPGALTYTENADPLVIDGGPTSVLTVSDLDNDNLVSATVAIANFTTGDNLSFGNQNGITGTYNAANGLLTLIGTATVAQYQTALQSVAYNSTSENPSTTPRIIQFSVSDGTDTSVITTRTINVIAVNDAPAGDILDINLPLNAPDTIVDLFNAFSDAEDIDSALTYEITDNTNLTLFRSAPTISAGELTLPYAPNISGTTTIKVKVTDTSGAFVEDAFTVTIAPNTPPLVTPTAAPVTYIEDAPPVAIDSAISLTDPDSPNLTGATVTLINFTPGEDILTFADQGGVTGTYVPVAGVLSLTGSASVAVYEAALRSITYSNTSNTPNTGDRTIQFTVTDGLANSNVGIRTLLVGATDDPPVVGLTAGATLYTENTPPVAIDTGVALSDADNTSLTGATVRITNFVLGQDVLSFLNQGMITGSFNAQTGVLTLTGTDSISNYRNALSSVAYSNTSDNPDPSDRTVEFSVTDGVATSNLAIHLIDIVVTSDPPTVTTTAVETSYTENAAAVAIDSGLNVSDSDSTDLTGAIVRITTNFVSGQDVLSFSNQGNITGSFDAATGVLTLTGIDSVDNYRAALRSVAYSNTSDNPTVTPRTVEFSVTDEAAPSNIATHTVTVIAVNDAPTTSGIGDVNINVNVPSTVIDLYSAFADVDDLDSALTYAVVGNTNSTLFSTAPTIDAAGQLTLTYANNVPGTGTITIRATDPGLLFAETTFTVNVAPNVPPTVTTTTDSTSYTENALPQAIDGGVTVSDADSPNLTGAIATIRNFVAGQDILSFNPQNGITGSFSAGVLTLTGSASAVSYQAALQSVAYSNSSENPDITLRTIDFSVTDGLATSNLASHTVQVISVNDAPMTSGIGNLNVIVNSPDTVVNLYNAFADAEDADSALTYTVISNSNSSLFNGNPTIDSTGQLILAYANSTTGTSVITVQARDTGGLSIDTAFTVSVNLNTPPTVIATSSPLLYVESAPAVFLDAGLLLSDPDGTNLTGATITLLGFVAGQDTLTFTDQNGITGTFDNTTGVLALTGSAAIATYQAALRSITYSNTSFDPNPSDRTLQFTVNDGTDPSNIASRTLRVIAIANPPVVTTTSGSTPYTENAAAQVIDGGLTVSDVDSANLAGATVTLANFVSGQDILSFTGQNGITGNFNAATGVLTLTGSASVADYQAVLQSVAYGNSSENPTGGDRMLQFSVTDGTSPSNIATHTVQVIPVNDAPTTSGISNVVVGINAPDTVISLYPAFADIEDADTALTYAVIDNSNPTLFSAAPAVNGTGQLTLAYAAGISGTSTLTVQATETGGLTVATTFTVTTNSAPVVTLTASPLSYTENAGAVGVDSGLSLSDGDSATLTGATVALSGYVSGQDSLAFTNQSGITGSFNTGTGILTLTGSAAIADYQTALRSITYINSSDNPSTATRAVQVSVTDGLASSNPVSRILQITPVNDAPSATPSRSTVAYLNSGEAIAIDSAILVRDPDNNSLSGATVKVIGFAAGQDVLSFRSQNGITGSFNTTTGVLSLLGVSSVENYQTALQSITYTNSNSDPGTTPRLIQFTVFDGIANSDPNSGTIQVVFRNTPALLDLNGSDPGINFINSGVAGTSIRAVDTDLTVTDIDGSTLSSALIVISNPILWMQERLSVDPAGTGITAVYDARAGVLSLSGTASLEAYQQVLRTVTYSNIGLDPDATTRNILFVVNDGQDNSTTAITTLRLTSNGVIDGDDHDDGNGESPSLVTTPETDIITAPNTNDTISSILSYLQQNDTINGGDGIDTFVLQDGAGTATIDVGSTSNQVRGITPTGTTITGFERFDLSSFTGDTFMTGSDLLDDVLIGGLGDDAIAGNAGNDTLTGNAGNDTLDGGLGNDVLIGGSGDDLYILDSLNDSVTEGLDGGTDTVQSSANLVLGLGDNLENLTLIDDATVGIGNSLNNQLTGNQRGNTLVGDFGDDVLLGDKGKDKLLGGFGNDSLTGGAGRDRLIGGKGKDGFYFTNAKRDGCDVITDFRAADDTLFISRGGFSRTLKRGKLKAGQFTLGTGAGDRSDRFIYNSRTGTLFFDGDGLGGSRQIQIAKLSNKAGITQSDIVIVS